MVDKFLATSADVAETVRAQRAALRLTQAQLAERVGVGRRFIMDLEAGHPRAELDKVLDVLKALDVNVLAIPSVPSTANLRTFDYDAHMRSFRG
jgi:HTH-type transcriptional regulator/antitoxin HipB